MDLASLRNDVGGKFLSSLVPTASFHFPRIPFSGESFSMRHHLLHISAVACFLISLASDAAAEAVKVFLLAGHANMTGTASADNLPDE